MSLVRFGALVVVLGMSSSLRAQELPLEVGVTHIKGNLVEGVLINHASVAATAWSVEFITTAPDGSDIRRGQTEDNYITTAHRDMDSQRIPKLVPAGGMYPFTMNIGLADGAEARTVKARIIAAIFEDGSAAGDATIIEDRFFSRQTDRDTYAALISDLRAAISKGGRREDALALTAHLTTHRERYPAPGIVEGLLQNLRMVLKSQTNNPETALPILESMFVAEHAAAVKHSVRRNSGQ